MNLRVLKAWFIYLFWWQIKHQSGCSSQCFPGWGCGAVIHWLNWIACCFMGFFPVKPFGTHTAGYCLKDEQRAAGLTKAGNIFKLMYTERPLKQEWCGHISLKTNQANPSNKSTFFGFQMLKADPKETNSKTTDWIQSWGTCSEQRTGTQHDTLSIVQRSLPNTAILGFSDDSLLFSLTQKSQTYCCDHSMKWGNLDTSISIFASHFAQHIAQGNIPHSYQANFFLFLSFGARLPRNLPKPGCTLH